MTQSSWNPFPDWARATVDATLAAARRVWGAPPAQLQVAALPWRKSDGRLEVMLVTSRDSGRWVVPKGWPERGEALWDAAAREAAEEAGLSGTISAAELGRFAYGKVKGSGAVVRCEVAVFPLEVAAVASKWPEKGQRRRRWFSPADAAGRVQEKDLARLIERLEARTVPPVG